MDYTKEILLDVNAVDNFKFVQAKQGDRLLRILNISLLKDGIPYDPSADHMQFRCQKSDGHAVVLTDEDTEYPVTYDDGVYTVTLTAQCLAAAGRATCDLALLDSDGGILSTATFILDIIPMPDAYNTLLSSDAYERLEEAMEQAEGFAAEKVDKPSDSTPANYVPTSDGEGGYSWEKQQGGSGDAGTISYDPTEEYADGTVGKELSQLSADKADKPIIKSAMDSVAVAGAQYFLGTQSAVSITMPTTAKVGQEIKVFFKSGSTAATLTCDLIGFDYTPKANTAVLLTFRLVHKADAQVTGDVDEWTVEVEEG